MKIPISILTALLFSSVLSFAENGFVTLTSNDGKAINAKLISKDESSVLIEMENGKEFQIPYTKLSEDSVDLIKNWTDPVLALFEKLNSEYNFIFTEGKGDPDEIREFLSMSKEYGYFTEFGEEGVSVLFPHIAA
jgi:hypothetical protein